MKSILLIVGLLLLTGTASASWNESWTSHLNITTTSTTPENDFQILFSSDNFTIPLDMWSGIDQNGNDTRIINYNHTIEFPIWIEHFTARDNYSIWINVTDNASFYYIWSSYWYLYFFSHPPAKKAC